LIRQVRSEQDKPSSSGNDALMSIRIHPATASDTEGLVRVVQAVYEEYGFTWDASGYHADLYGIEAHYLARGHAFWVARDAADAIVGTVALELFDRLPGEPGAVVRIDETARLGGCDAALERLYVHPAARRQGVGRALVETVIAAARARGRGSLDIWSDKRFVEAHRLYHRLGAVSVAERICHDPDQSPEWGLMLRL
jgi:putative acetyltransferase